MSRWPAGSQSGLREANTAKIVDAVKRFGGLTQVELAEATSLSTATVSAIVKELGLSGLIETHPTSRSGRRAQLVTIARRAGLVAAVQIGNRSMRVRLSDVGQDVLADRSMPLPTDHAEDTVLDRITLLIIDMLGMIAADADDLIGVCIALPAPIDPETGLIAYSGVMRRWETRPVAEVVEQRIGCPVLVEKDANLAALAEATLGTARDVKDSLFVHASYTASAGVVLNSQIYRGRSGTAGEIGHVQVDPAGSVCACGQRGCLETVAGAEAVTAPLRATFGQVTFKDVIARAAAGDPGCARVVADAATALGRVVAAAHQSLAPEVITVGGELVDAGPIFLLPFAAAVRDNAPQGRTPRRDPVPSSFGRDAVLTGAIIHILQSTDPSQLLEDRS
ncbi:ROK family transcriptional regulator [Microbacterium foliorum]|uniref:N-acetylglucosamine repressor n=1 Tax=Microbacterium foliorum TaxID=104336 RepID=A0A0F0KY66_9MICO|nr:ROK family transcriptional regulator [Microbacterium foliorum]AXL13517.1 ROK family transcriptional regulator [Microbacterium foliorum]KJL25842.1 N-acetylglucosamine repressor [Microbacterium foliorum]CAH0227971.1 N-acetylglucosamine repressor [Microbacterium foliorum]CAH0234951.1 N-acetylglucosamine repressor [Microbacterium foliorum]